MGLHNEQSIFNSELLAGSIRRSFKKKRRTQQAITLSKHAVMALGRAAVHAPEPEERVLAGSCRFMVSARSRGADTVRICEEPTLDINEDTNRGYIDGTGDVTKTSRRTMETSRHGVEMSAHS